MSHENLPQPADHEAIERVMGDVAIIAQLAVEKGRPLSAGHATDLKRWTGDWVVGPDESGEAQYAKVSVSQTHDQRDVTFSQVGGEHIEVHGTYAQTAGHDYQRIHPDTAAVVTMDTYANDTVNYKYFQAEIGEHGLWERVNEDHIPTDEQKQRIVSFIHQALESALRAEYLNQLDA